MAAPISNNNPALIDHKRTGAGSNQETGNGNKAAAGSEETAARRQDDAVSVSNAAQALGSTSGNSANIRTSEQAAELAQNISAFFADNGRAALAAHGNGNSGLASLLKAS